MRACVAGRLAPRTLGVSLLSAAACWLLPAHRGTFPSAALGPAMPQLYALYLWGNQNLSGCIPAAWQAQITSWDTEFSFAENVYDGTNITGFCSS